MLNLYTETAVHVKPSPSSKRVEIQIARANGSYDRSKYSKRLERSERLATDEKAYAAEYLADASSVFFRQSHSFPRSFLWRTIARQKLLEISNADFARGQKDQEADTTLAFEFQDPISPRGISICDSSNKDEFYVYVLTQENEVFEIQLSTAFFQKPETIPQDTKSWCSAIRASSLSIDKAFQIYAANPHEIFVSFASGRVQHWERDETQQQWTHIVYDDKTWGSSLFSIVSRKAHPDIDFDGMRLAYNTAHAMTRSGQYLFTACLNHTLRIWHLQSGKLVETRDLLDQARDSQDQVQLNPAEPGYIQFLEATNMHEQVLLTYSPLDGGQVKLWKVGNNFEDDTSLFTIEDLAPTSALSLPDPDPTGSSVWSLAGLKVVFDKHTKEWQAWVLWRSNNYHKSYSLNFSLADLSHQWRNDWVTVSTASTKTQGPDFVPSDSQDVSSKWLDYLLFPGRYSSAVIETALAQYSNVVDARLSSNDRGKPLQERMTLSMASQVTLRRYDDSTVDYERFSLETDQQWRQFWRILESMNEGRYAPLSLASDPVSGMVVLAMTDMCCIVRECSNLELLQNNTPAELGDLQLTARARWPYRKTHFNVQQAGNISTFLSAARKFLCSFPPELMLDFLQTLEEDLYIDSDDPTQQRIVNFFNAIDFANAVPDDVEKELLKDLSSIGGLEAIQDDLYTATLHFVSEHKARHGTPQYVKTPFGIQVTLTASVAETVMVRHVLLSMLAIVIFIDESEKFDTSKFFDELVQRLRIQERNLWLATHYRLPTRGDLKEGGTTEISVMQDVFADTVRPQPSEHYPMPFLITQHINDNLEWISGTSRIAAEDVAAQSECDLLKFGNLNLAVDFSKFLPATPWSVYVKGRLNLAQGNFQEALLHFQDSAASLSSGKAIGDLRQLSAFLLTADDAACFNGGLALYLQHIIALFENQQAFSYVAEVAQLALQALETDRVEPVPNFKQNILLRLFSAEMACSKFDKAYQALVQFSDPVLQRASVTDLIDAMLDSSSSLTDTAGIVKQIQQLPVAEHPQLANSIDQHLASLAKKQTTIPAIGGLWQSSSTIDYLSILHALRLSRQDYRGVITLLFDRLRIVQKSGRARSDPQATSLRHALLALINILTCVADDEAYVITNSSDDPRIGRTGMKRARDQASSQQESARKRQRVIITLDDLRREYQKVLDRCSRIERGDFEFNGDGEGSDEEEDVAWEGSRLQVDQNRTSGALVLSNGDAMQLS